MKEITIKHDGKEIKAQVSEEELKKLMQEPEWPQMADKYWFVSDWFGPEWVYMVNDSVNKNRIALGNFYRTKEEAENALRAQKLIAAVAKRRKELNGDWKLDWENADDKYFICFYNGNLHPFIYISSDHGSPFGTFKNIESAQTIIAEFQDELTWYFTEYQPSIN